MRSQATHRPRAEDRRRARGGERKAEQQDASKAQPWVRPTDAGLLRPRSAETRWEKRLQRAEGKPTEKGDEKRPVRPGAWILRPGAQRAVWRRRPQVEPEVGGPMEWAADTMVERRGESTASERPAERPMALRMDILGPLTPLAWGEVRRVASVPRIDRDGLAERREEAAGPQRGSAPRTDQDGLAERLGAEADLWHALYPRTHRAGSL
jgi:hypothetical protein